MLAKLHAKLKQFYPMSEICRLIDAHFARFDALDQKVSEIRSHDIAQNDAALLQGVTFLVQQLQQQQRIYQELDQKRERDYAMSRRTTALMESLNAHLTLCTTQNDERGSQLTVALEQFAKSLRDPAGRGARFLALAETLDERTGQLESRMLEQLDCLRKQFAELAALLRESDSRRSDQIAQIDQRVSDIAARQLVTAREPEGLNGQGTFPSQLRPAAVVVKDGHFELENPDITLLMHLAPLLPNRTALDIGANIGAVSGRLLAAGYEVFAFEPFPSVFAQLNGSFGHDENFHAHQLAIGHGDRTMELHIAEEISPAPKYGDSVTQYHSLVPHSMPADLQFSRRIDVRVRSLDSLVRANLVPPKVGLIKIDTEGYDLEVIRGMGACSCNVLISEFWDPKMVFGRSGAMNRLSDLAAELRSRGYRWHIVVYRLYNKPISYYCNQDQSLDESWGNAIFFKDKPLFDEALHWCAAVLPPTYFTA